MDQAGFRAHERAACLAATLTARLPVYRHSGTQRGVDSFTVAGAAPES